MVHGDHDRNVPALHQAGQQDCVPAHEGGPAGVVAKTEIRELGCQLGCQTAFSSSVGSRFCL